MTFTFTENLPDHLLVPPVLISGQHSLQFGGVEYLLIQNGAVVNVYQICYQYSCGPFKAATIQNGILAVGHQGHFYLFDLSHQKSLLILKLDVYFSELAISGSMFYVADTCGIYAVNIAGQVQWSNLHLALDGVVINRIADNKIYGKGEHNPPGGWEPFVLDAKTGKKIEENVS